MSEAKTVVRFLGVEDCPTPGMRHEAEVYQVGRLTLLICQFCHRHQGYRHTGHCQAGRGAPCTCIALVRESPAGPGEATDGR